MAGGRFQSKYVQLIGLLPIVFSNCVAGPNFLAQFLEEADADPVAKSTAVALPSTLPGGQFHYSTVRRKRDRALEQKRKKREWMMKMYKEGLTRKSEEQKEHGADIDFDDPAWEDEAASLLQWSDNLDYDRYLEDWSALGTSATPGVPAEVGSLRYGHSGLG